jgi:hypothetical protein
MEVAAMVYTAIGARSWLFRLLLVPLALIVSADFTLAQSWPTIVRVEEDWELVVGAPDPDSAAPQVTCVISPLCHVGSLHAAFELNQQSLPAFDAGGLQLQVWNGEVPVSYRGFPNNSVMEQPSETVRWTQAMEVDNGTLTFEIVNGSSTTWGNFGGQGYLKVSISTTLTSLPAYRPSVSVNNSGVGYAANRVESLVLKRIRVHTSTGEVFEDTTERIVHGQE